LESGNGGIGREGCLGRVRISALLLANWLTVLLKLQITGRIFGIDARGIGESYVGLDRVANSYDGSLEKKLAQRLCSASYTPLSLGT